MLMQLFLAQQWQAALGSHIKGDDCEKGLFTLQRGSIQPGRELGLGSQAGVLQPQLGYLLLGGPWASDLIAPCLNFSICRMGIIILPTTYGCGES